MTMEENHGTNPAIDPLENSVVGLVMIADLMDEIEAPSEPTRKTEESLRDLIEMLQNTAAAIETMCGEASLNSHKSLRKIRNLHEDPQCAESSTLPAASVASRWDRFSDGLTDLVKAARSVAENGKHQQSSCPAGSPCLEDPISYSNLLYVCGRVLNAHTRLLYRLNVL